VKYVPHCGNAAAAAMPAAKSTMNLTTRVGKSLLDIWEIKIFAGLSFARIYHILRIIFNKNKIRHQFAAPRPPVLVPDAGVRRCDCRRLQPTGNVSQNEWALAQTAFTSTQVRGLSPEKKGIAIRG
jgi:hypothetical protein